MVIQLNEQLLALSAVRAQVLGADCVGASTVAAQTAVAALPVPAHAAVAAVRVFAGRAGAGWAVPAEAGAGAAQVERARRVGSYPSTTAIRLLAPKTQVEKTNVSSVEITVDGMDPVGGVRGIPPRGWPV